MFLCLCYLSTNFAAGAKNLSLKERTFRMFFFDLFNYEIEQKLELEYNI